MREGRESGGPVEPHAATAKDSAVVMLATAVPTSAVWRCPCLHVCGGYPTYFIGEGNGGRRVASITKASPSTPITGRCRQPRESSGGGVARQRRAPSPIPPRMHSGPLFVRHTIARSLHPNSRLPPSPLLHTPTPPRRPSPVGCGRAGLFRRPSNPGCCCMYMPAALSFLPPPPNQFQVSHARPPPRSSSVQHVPSAAAATGGGSSAQ